MVDEKKFEDFVFLKALENAVEHNSNAQSKPLIGRCVAEFPDIKQDMQHYMNSIERIVEQVNLMNSEDRVKKLEELNPEFFQSKEEDKGKKKDPIPDLPEAENGIRVRWEPAPSGHLHIGHAFGIVFNYAFVEKYGGEFILRFGDTNPENISIENYNKIIEDVSWLTEDNISEIHYQSDRLPTYYKYLRQLVERGKAYVCTCDPQVFKSFNDSSTPCPHREMSLEDQSKELDKCFNGDYNAGEAVVRFKADLENKNPALRDFPIARINTTPHIRTGDTHRVWPLMNLAVALDDVLMEITHVIRGKDHEINMHRQKMIQESLGLKPPHYFHLGRVKFTDLNLSKSELTEKIQNKTYWGWDDPRVPSIVSFKRRGYVSKAFRNMIINSGISKRDSKISEEEFYKSLNYFNKQEIESISPRAFFVHNPKKVHISDIHQYPDNKLELLKHPDNKSMGKREFDILHDYFIDSYDFENLEEGDLLRLMHFANFKVEEKKEDTLILSLYSVEYDKSLDIKRNIHFVACNSYEEADIILQDASTIHGVCEPLNNPKERSPFQFERFGFVVFDHLKDDKKTFFFSHR